MFGQTEEEKKTGRELARDVVVVIALLIHSGLMTVDEAKKSLLDSDGVDFS